MSRGRGASSALVCYFISALLILLIANHKQTFGAPSQQQQQQNRQQQQATSNELQTSQDYARGDSDLVALVGFGRGGSGGYTVNQAKRARKMSAFMPMRGRKDGRDLVGVDSLRVAQSARYSTAPLALMQPQQQMTGLIGGGNQRQFAHELEAPSGDTSGLLRMLVGAGTSNGPAVLGHVPRQFVAQFEQRRPASSSSVLQQQQLDGSREQSVGQLPEYSALVSGDPSAGGVPIMQAKLRRAFHPMRGKRGDTTGDELEVDAALDEDLLNGGDVIVDTA